MVSEEDTKNPWYKILENEYGNWENIGLNNTQDAIVKKIIQDDQNGNLTCYKISGSGGTGKS